MFGKKEEVTSELEVKEPEVSGLKKNESSFKDLIAPGGIDCSYTNHIEISSMRTRYARILRQIL